MNNLKFNHSPNLNGKTIPEALRISEERTFELIKMMRYFMGDDLLLMKRLPEILEFSETVEEYTFCCITIGAWLTEYRILNSKKNGTLQEG